jgi:acetyltransferase-like isoleucine patch superfamily enzyme
MWLGNILHYLYKYESRWLRTFILWFVRKLENGEYYSLTLRRIFKDYHKVEVGLYTHGSCFIPGNFDRHTTVGRYCSIAANVYVFNRDHPTAFKSTHAFFFNSAFTYVPKDLVDYKPLKIGNDVWIGHGVIILAGVTEIGDGAVIGAGSVVSKNVLPYAIAVGHPVRTVKFRFDKETIAKLRSEKWWEKDIEQLMGDLVKYTQPYTAYLNSRINEDKEASEQAINAKN